SRFLRERFVLHWQSERPAPRVTVDFGDGRKLSRTVTGNSVHYILNAEGELIDALPGLYGPQAFLRELRSAETAARRVAAFADARTRAAFLRRFHAAQITNLAAAWQNDLRKAGITVPPERANVTGKRPAAIAAQAAPRAVTKMVSELPLLGVLTPDRKALARITDEAGWNEIARLHPADARLDAASVALLRSLRRAPDGKATQDARLAVVVTKFETLLALDTVRNQYAMHLTLHEWLAGGGANELETFNERVYAELFLTPRADPWLGLVTDDDFPALENDGMIY
ncbi:MAG TPA: hypothetical protein VM870_10965, partial [Pyrinomonadaceae bacterium]|nr:hypothetical protein [Pyrinomonadaceae bacterium]